MPHRILTAAFAVCLFTLIVAAKWATFGKYGSPMPDWDQWDAEGGALFIPWHKGEDLLPHVVRPHNEHRVILTKLQNLALGVANGQWDSRLEATTNALLHAATAAALWLAATRWFAWPALTGLFVLLAALFGLPLAWQNVLGGFHSQQYWLLGLSLAAIGLLPSRRPGSGGWWLGAFSATAALGSMGSGLLASAAVLIVLGWRLVRREESWRGSWPTLLLCAVLVAAGLALRVEVEWHAHMKAKSAQDIALSLLHSLQWPWRGQHWAAVVLWLPWGLAAWRIATSPRGGTVSRDPGGTLIAALGGWVLLQLLATAYARGAGGDYPASRYMDTLAFGVAVNSLALAWLAREAKAASAPKRNMTPALVAVWALTLGVGINAFLRDIVVHELKGAREYYDKAEGHLRRYLATNDPAFLAHPDIPYPSAQGIIDYLSNPALRAMLPAPIPPPRELENEGGAGVFERNRAIGFNLVNPPQLGLSSRTPPLDFTSTWGSHTAGTGSKATGEWRSKPLPAPAPKVRWLRFETAGNLGEPGVSLQLRSAADDRVLAEVKPSRVPGDAWRTAFVPAPREAYRIVASDRDPTRWLAFSGPAEMGGLSYLAREATRHAPLIFGVTTGVTALLAAVALIRRRRG
ncbi:MAG: hypothetical protein ACKODK_01750 [Opitutaceae bacterium]